MRRSLQIAFVLAVVLVRTTCVSGVGLESGIITMPALDDNGRSTWTTTFTTQFNNRPLVGVALEQLQMPKSDFYIIRPKVDANRTTLTISLEDASAFISVSYSWIASMGTPAIVYVCEDWKTLYDGTRTYILPSDFPSSFPNSLVIKVDMLTAGFNQYVSNLRNFNIKAKPLRGAVDIQFNDNVIKLNPNGNTLIAYDTQYSLPFINSTAFNYTLDTGTNNLDGLVFTFIVHTIIYQVMTDANTITGYARINQELLSAGQTSSIRNVATNGIVDATPITLYGFNHLTMNRPNQGAYIDLNVISTIQVQAKSVGLQSFYMTESVFYFYSQKLTCVFGDVKFNTSQSLAPKDWAASSGVDFSRSNLSQIALSTPSWASTNVKTSVGGFYTLTFSGSPNSNQSSSALVVTVDNQEIYRRKAGQQNFTDQTVQFIGKSSTTTIKFTSEGSQKEAGWRLFNIWVTQYNYIDVESGECVETCSAPKVFSAKGVVPYCGECSNPLLGRSDFVNIEGMCQCPKGTFNNGIKCTNSPVANCAQFSSSIGCILCENQKKPVDQVCDCPTHTYFNSQTSTCDDCYYACKECISTERCSSCNADDNRVFDGLSCNCKPGFYDYGIPKCLPCPDQCNNCSIIAGASAPSCIDCKSPFATYGGDRSCICNQGYYADTAAGYQCKRCHQTCKTCTSSGKSQCLTCRNDRQMVSGIPGPCTCKGLGQTTQETQAGACQSIFCSKINPFCTSCSLDTCLSCDPFLNRAIVGGKCECIDTFYTSSDNKTCLKCGNACSTCTNNSDCQCYPYALKNTNNGSCYCPPGFYQDDSVKVCSACSDNCQTCINLTFCTKCYNTHILSRAKCMCKVGQFYNNLDMCVPCQLNCDYCTSQSNCTKCKPGFYANTSGACSPTCPNSVNEGDTCADCPPQCMTCRGTLCTQCMTSFYSYRGGCLDRCPERTIIIGNNCSDCSSSCGSCSGTTTNCSTCINGYLLNGQCLATCPNGTSKYDDIKQCVNCKQGCSSCSPNNVSNCLVCNAGLNLHNGNCVTFCPVGTFPSDGVCRSNCGWGFYRLNSQCYQCQSPCRTCISQVACTRCVSGYFLFNQTCVQRCPAGTTPIRGRCSVGCDNTTCQTCSGQTCLGCKQGFRVSNGVCIPDCSGSFYYNGSSCVSCPAGCVACKSDKSCSVCSANFSLINGVCNKCGQMCVQCSSPNTCTKCIAGYNLRANGVCSSQCPRGQAGYFGVCFCQEGFKNGDTCVAVCPSQWGPIDGVCKPCISDCEVCSNSAVQCDRCRDGSVLINGKCVSSSSCSEGQTDIFGKCVRLCADTQYFFKGFCVCTCPNDYKVNSIKTACVSEAQVQTFRVSSSTRTITPRVSTATPRVATAIPRVASAVSSLLRSSLQNIRVAQDRRVAPNSSSCASNKYNRDGQCVICPPNCKECSDRGFCVSCNSGYYAGNDGNCLQAAVCGANFLSIQDSCATTCPYGSFLSARFCTRICQGSLFFYMGACYEKCPSNTFSNGFGCDSTFGISRASNCPAGFFRNSSGDCQKCQFPCADCRNFRTNCISCASGVLNADGGICEFKSGNNLGTQLRNQYRSGDTVVIEVNVTSYPSLTTVEANQFFKIDAILNQNVTVTSTQSYDPSTKTITVVSNVPRSVTAGSLVLSLNHIAIANAYNRIGVTNLGTPVYNISLGRLTSRGTASVVQRGAPVMARTEVAVNAG